MRRQKKLTVTVPAGINDGQTFTLRGQGDAGQNGGPAGDANITVTVRPDPTYERDGYDIWCDIPVTFSQAALGDEITVPTLEGKVKYNVPEGTQSGTACLTSTGAARGISSSGSMLRCRNRSTPSRSRRCATLKEPSAPRTMRSARASLNGSRNP